MVISNGTLQNGSKIKIDYDGIEITKRVEGKLPVETFKVDVDGNVSIKGDLTASTGAFGEVATDKGNVLLGGSDPLIVRRNQTEILKLTNAGVLTVAGFTASESAFFSGTKSTFASNDAGVYIASDGIALGENSPFKVTSAGALTATSGSIGGFEIGTTDLTAGTGTTSVGISTGSTSFFAGDATPTSAPFRVTNEGALTATNAIITGTLKQGSTIEGSLTKNVVIEGGNRAINYLNVGTTPTPNTLGTFTAVVYSNGSVIASGLLYA